MFTAKQNKIQIIKLLQGKKKKDKKKQKLKTFLKISTQT